jgi:hypothetical protein
MTVDYLAKRATADRLLTKFGAPGFIISYTTSGGGGVMNPPTQTEVQTPVTVVLADYSEREKSQATSIQIGDRKALVSAGAIVPTTAMKLRWQGVDYQIEDVMETSPAGVAVLYELRVRR